MATTDKKKDKTGGQPVKVPQREYDDLQLLQIRHPGKSLSVLVGELLRRGLDSDEDTLATLRRLKAQNPDASLDELTQIVVSSGLLALTKIE